LHGGKERVTKILLKITKTHPNRDPAIDLARLSNGRFWRLQTQKASPIISVKSCL